MASTLTAQAKRTSARRPPKRRFRRQRRPPLNWADKKMTPAMVDRLFWRAGFGPRQEDRDRWVGKRVVLAVNWLLTTKPSLVGAPPSNNNAPLAPTANDTDLVLQWVDRMVRVDNPLIERLTFMWHDHFGINRNDVTPRMAQKHIELLRQLTDVTANPAADFRSLMQAVTIDPAMLRFLTGEFNVRRNPNENFAREIMELYGIGVTNEQGQPNYTETDVKELARAFSGWQINNTNAQEPVAYFTASRWDPGTKTALGRTGSFDTPQAVDVVLAHPNHAPFLVRRIWDEFVQSPPEPAMLRDLASTYVRRGLRLRPVLKKILTSRAMFESANEPNMIKSPVVFVAGTMRAMGLTITSGTPRNAMQSMGQDPYFPPDVSGWEGGQAWLDSNTAIARFRLLNDLNSDAVIDRTDATSENAQQAYDRAYAAVGKPWLAPNTVAQITAFAATQPGANIGQRRVRQRVLRALMLGGPDGQVM
jgi:uncharacterized protein (DUF1800 family)